MSKNKTSNIIEKLTTTAQSLGVVAMSAALTLSVTELPDDAKRAVLPAQPAPQWANAGENNKDNNPIRSEREETAPHFVSYSVTQRTPGRSGRT